MNGPAKRTHTERVDGRSLARCSEAEAPPPVSHNGRIA